MKISCMHIDTTIYIYESCLKSFITLKSLWLMFYKCKNGCIYYPGHEIIVIYWSSVQLFLRTHDSHKQCHWKARNAILIISRCIVAWLSLKIHTIMTSDGMEVYCICGTECWSLKGANGFVISPICCNPAIVVTGRVLMDWLQFP